MVNHHCGVHPSACRDGAASFAIQLRQTMELLQQHQQLDAYPKMRHHHHPLITPTSSAYDQASRAVVTMTLLCRSLSHSGKYRRFQSAIKSYCEGAGSMKDRRGSTEDDEQRTKQKQSGITEHISATITLF